MKEISLKKIASFFPNESEEIKAESREEEEEEGYTYMYLCETLAKLDGLRIIFII